VRQKKRALRSMKSGTITARPEPGREEALGEREGDGETMGAWATPTHRPAVDCIQILLRRFCCVRFAMWGQHLFRNTNALLAEAYSEFQRSLGDWVRLDG